MQTKSLNLLLAILLLSVAPAWAQKFGWEAQLAPVTQAGYHRVLLSPQVIGSLQPSLADLRLYQPNGKEVPYLLQAEKPVQYRNLFKPYQILHYTRKPGGMSKLLIHNSGKRTINNISLLIGNADVQKEVTLSGSDNQQDWYVLKARDVLHAIRSERSTAEVKLLDFPLSNYQYLRLQLNDSASAPLNILKAGYYDTQTEAGKYTRIPVQSFTRTDSTATKTTYLRLHFAYPVYPEQVFFHIASPQLYHRTGKVILGQKKVWERRRRKKRRRRRMEEISVPLLLHSNAPAVVELTRHKVEEVVIEIENADNPPLVLDSVQVLQLNRYLVASLTPAQAYTLRFGNKDLPAPDYDLAFFQDSIPANTPVIQVQHIKSIAKPKSTSPRSSTLLIWVAIAAVASGLVYMTWRLLKDMEKNKAGNR